MIEKLHVPWEGRNPQPAVGGENQYSCSCTFFRKPFQTPHTHHTKHSGGPQPVMTESLRSAMLYVHGEREKKKRNRTTPQNWINVSELASRPEQTMWALAVQQDLTIEIQVPCYNLRFYGCQVKPLCIFHILCFQHLVLSMSENKNFTSAKKCLRNNVFENEALKHEQWVYIT